MLAELNIEAIGTFILALIGIIAVAVQGTVQAWAKYKGDTAQVGEKKDQLALIKQLSEQTFDQNAVKMHVQERLAKEQMAMQRDIAALDPNRIRPTVEAGQDVPMANDQAPIEP